LRRWLLLSYVSVVLVVLVVLEVPLGVLFARHERDLLFTQAQEEATGLAIAAAEDLQHGRSASLDALVDRYRAAGGGEVLVTYGNGQMVDSDLDGGADRAELTSQLTAAKGGRSVTGAESDENRPFAVAAVPIRQEHRSDADGGPVIGALLLSIPATDTYHRSRDLWLLLTGFGLVVLALTALLGARLASALSRPVGALERSVARLGAGDLTSRAPQPAGPPELRALAGEFNRMAGELQRLVSAQTQFVADASHQLRSPLTALRLRLENLESSVDPASAGSVAAANREVQRLSRLVDGLLTLSRADEEHPARRPVDVDAVITERVEAWGALAEERGVRLSVRDGLREPTAPLVPGDLEQILDNLLSNALEATPTGRSITVETVESGHGIDVAVNDEGVGMDADQRARAFDRFWQGPGQGTGTSGLGLAIVRQLARRNGARVELLPGADRGVSAIVHLDR